MTWELKEERGRFQREAGAGSKPRFSPQTWANLAANTLGGLTGNGGGIFSDRPLECARELVRAILPGGSGTWKRSTQDKDP